MKARINGKRYDTDTADRVCGWDNDKGRNDLYFQKVTLYQKRTGEYFLHGEGGAATAWGWEDKSGARSFGEGISPIRKVYADWICDALKNGCRIWCHRGANLFEAQAQREFNGEIDVFLGRASRFAPAFENSGGRIG